MTLAVDRARRRPEQDRFRTERSHRPRIGVLTRIIRCVIVLYNGLIQRMPDANPPLLKGTLAVLILKALAWAPMHGFELAAWIEEHSGAAFELDAAGIYQSLYRMESQGLVDAEWGISEKQRRARYYKLTAKGRAQLRQEADTWRRYAAGVTAILDATPNKA